MESDAGTSVAERLLDLLGCLSSSAVTIREASEASGIPLSTVHRLMRPLVARKYALRHGRGRYVLGTASVNLGARANLDSIIVTATRPVIADLARICKCTVHLGVFRDNLVRYLVKADPGRLPTPPSQELSELEAYCTGIGKVLLAHLADDRLKEYLRLGDFVPLTHDTITQVDDLQRELSVVRRQGWAMDRGEMYAELRCAAVPIQDETGRLMAAISVTEVCTDENFDEVEERLLALLPRMTESAERISFILGVH